MSKVMSSTPIVVYSKQVSEFVSQYRICVQKTASSILELAYVLKSAKDTLNKDEFKLFRAEISANAKKDSFIKKLNCIADKASRFVAIQEKLPAAYTTLYALSQLTDEEFERAQSEDLIKPNLTAVELSKFKFKSPKLSAVTSDKVTLTLKSSSASFHKVLQKIQTLCAANDIELKSSFDLTILNHQDFDEIQDASFRPVRKAA